MLADKYDDPTYLLESWILYGIGVLALLLRWAVRIRTVGFEGFQGDDYLAIVVLACFTSDAVAVKQIQHHGSNVDFTEAEMQAMTAHERSLVSYGSKLQFLCWYTYPTLMWALKGCMLFFVSRSPGSQARTKGTDATTVQSTHTRPRLAAHRQVDGVRMRSYIHCHPHRHIRVLPPIPRELGNTTISTSTVQHALSRHVHGHRLERAYRRRNAQHTATSSMVNLVSHKALQFQPS